MNFLEQQNKLSRILGDSNTSSEDLFDLASRKAELNRGEVKFAKEGKCLLRYHTGTVSSQAIALPNGYGESHVLVVDNEMITGIREMALQDWERLLGDNRFYLWTNENGIRAIRCIDLVSDGLTYQHWYFAKPITDLSADTDESLLEDEFREGAVYYAASELLPMAGKFQLSEFYKDKFEALALKAKMQTEALYMSSVRAYPDLGPNFQSSQDRQGIDNSEIF